MKVVLVDVIVTGHHPEYMARLAAYLKSHDDEVRGLIWHPKDKERFREFGVAFDFDCVVDGVSRGSSRFDGSLYSAVKTFSYAHRLASAWKADVVHVLYTERFELPISAVLRRQYGESWFGTLFWPYYFHPLSSVVLFPRWLFHRANLRALGGMINSGHMAGLFVPTSRIRDQLVKSGAIAERSAGRVVVAPDPIMPLDTPIPTMQQARDYLRLPQDRPVVLFFGAMRFDKGPDVLLSALRHIRGPFSAVFAGEPGVVTGPMIDDVRATLGPGQQVVGHLQRVGEQELPYYFSAANVVVLPYRRVFRGTSGVLNRAVQFDRPVVATDVGEVGALVRQYQLGPVVLPENPSVLASGIDMVLRRNQATRAGRERYLRDMSFERLGGIVRSAYKRSRTR